MSRDGASAYDSIGCLSRSGDYRWNLLSREEKWRTARSSVDVPVSDVLGLETHTGIWLVGRISHNNMCTKNVKILEN